MKSIHALPTDTPSRLFLNKVNNKLLLEDIVNPNLKKVLPSGTYQNIYITNDEKPKKGDWVLGDFPDNPIGKVISIYGEEFTAQSLNGDKNGLAQYDSKKIILTTDLDLIQDGVQEIDDEFLQWFVNNPSCEEVEVIEQYRKCCRNTDGKNENCIEPINCEGWLNNEYERPYKTNCEERFEGYKIIITKEEPKPHSFCETPDEKCKMNYCDENGCQNRKRVLVEPKKETETLEEAAERYANDNHNSYSLDIAFEYGANWQQEQDKNKYSEEDMEKAIKFGAFGMYGYQMGEEGTEVNQIKTFLETFKKK